MQKDMRPQSITQLMERRVCKVVLLGEGGVGKTSLVRRFVKDDFSDDYISTIGTKVTRKDTSFQDKDTELSMMLWDIHGQRTITPLHRSNYKGSQGALLVFDVTRKDTFENVQNILDELFSVTGPIPVVLLGNKYDIISELPKERTELESYLEKFEGADLDQRFKSYLTNMNPNLISTYKEDLGLVPEFRLVLRKDIDSFSKSSGTSFMFTSAKLGTNVEKAFTMLGEKILEEG